MDDLIATHLMQFVGLTAGVMAVTEFFPLPVGTPKGTRKRYTAVIYAVGAALIANAAGLLSMPVEGWRSYLGACLLAFISVGTAHGIREAKRKLVDNKKEASP